MMTLLKKYLLVQHRIITNITVSLNCFLILRRVHFDQRFNFDKRKQCMKDLASQGFGLKIFNIQWILFTF